MMGGDSRHHYEIGDLEEQVDRLYKEISARQDKRRGVFALWFFVFNGGAAFTLTGMIIGRISETIRKVLAGLGMTFLCISFAAAASKPNLVLITLDSVRADRMGFLGAKGGLTPSLDRLAGESIVFDHAYTQAPATVVSHATILSGAYPQSTGMSEIGGTLPPSLAYLPDLLRAQSYHTAAFVGSIDLDPQNGLAQGFDRGFPTYDAGFRPAIPGDARPPVTERSGGEVVTRALTWLDHNAQGPFFAWVHISDANVGGASYNAGITAADAAVGKLIRALQQRKLYGNTALIVVSSHGQSLGAHGEETHGIFLYEETIHVPLLIKLPQVEPAAKPASSRVAAKVRLVDVAPTVLEIAAIPGSLADAGTISVADRKGWGRKRPARLFPCRSATTRLWMEPARILARQQVSLHPRPKARTLRLVHGPGSHSQSGAEFEGDARHVGSAARQLCAPFQRRLGESFRGVEFFRDAETGVARLHRNAKVGRFSRGSRWNRSKDKIATANKVIEAALCARPVEARSCHCRAYAP
jgi:hypothetical protein